MNDSELPKYALMENERRFLVAGDASPEQGLDLENAAFVLIEDLYVAGSRLRLRAATASKTGSAVYKFCKKYETDDLVCGPIVNTYLSAQEYKTLQVLPGNTITKRRYLRAFGGHTFGIDVFQGDLKGLILCEAEAASRDDISALALPPWAAMEVTQDDFFTGGNLCRLSPDDLATKLSKMERQA